MTALQIIENLKTNKIARGTKITSCNNCVTIYYPVHKTLFADSQFNKDLGNIKLIYSNDFNKETIVNFHKVNNKGSIQIYII